MNEVVNWSAFDLTILGPALLAGLLVTLVHVPLGQRVLQRGIIFLDLAVAQVAGLGIILAYSFHWQPGGWQVQLIAMASAIASVVFLHFTERYWPEIQEAIIGSLFVLASSASVLLLATNPHGGEQLKELLVGQILWVTYDQLVPVAVLYGIIMALWFGVCRRFSSSLYFYLLFAVTITVSVQLIGIYLVFATLIMPALAIRKCSKYALVNGYIIGSVSYAFGLYLAAILDLPAGPIIVYSLALTSLFAAGIIAKKIRMFKYLHMY